MDTVSGHRPCDDASHSPVLEILKVLVVCTATSSVLLSSLSRGL